MDPKNVMTTSAGTPVDDNQNSLTCGEFGPILLQDFHLIDKLMHFDKERIPERVVHANGAGAHGYFEVTTDEGRKYCKAEFLNEIGKKTPMFARFSTVRGEKGSGDTIRDPRGFALKFYTEEGNFDMVCNNTPVFFVRDPIKFPDFIHSIKKHPQTNLDDHSTFWDFMSHTPESTHQFTILFSDRGIPDGYRHMHGFSSHTFKLVNIEGKQFWSKWHFRTDAGIKNLTDKEGLRLCGEDPKYATRDLFNHIDKGGVASWTLYFQIIPYEDAFTYHINIFDVTKVVSKKDYPLIEIGKMVLNRNPTNYFAEVEQSAFSPSHMVPGIEPSPDKMLQGRLFSYPDTHHYRLGKNSTELPINRPYRTKFGFNHERDGFLNSTLNGGGSPNYEPNSFGDNLKENKTYSIAPYKVEGYVSRYLPRLSKVDDYFQAGELYRKVMNDEDRTNLINNIVGHLKFARKDIQQRVVGLFTKCDEEYGRRVSEGLSSTSDDPTVTRLN